MHAVQAYMQRGDARHEEDAAVKDRALVAALNQSARWNESQLVLGGCTFLAQAWASAVQVRLPWTCLELACAWHRLPAYPGVIDCCCGINNNHGSWRVRSTLFEGPCMELSAIALEADAYYTGMARSRDML